MDFRSHPPTAQMLSAQSQGISWDKLWTANNPQI